MLCHAMLCWFGLVWFGLVWFGMTNCMTQHLSSLLSNFVFIVSDKMFYIYFEVKNTQAFYKRLTWNNNTFPHLKRMNF
jgi:hypothetical protein